MDTGKITLFSKTLESTIEHAARKIIRIFRHALKDAEILQTSPMENFTLEIITSALFKGVLESITEMTGNGCTGSNPEETVAELIRLGTPRKDVYASYKHLTVSLPNGSYRFYRETSGYPSGTVMVYWGNSYADFRSGYTPKELAVFITSLDSLLPKIDEAGEALFIDMHKEIVRRQAEQKAIEIAKQAVEVQLEAVLPGMGLECTYKISDGKVHLDLSRLFTAHIDIPLEELQALLSDPGRIEAALQAEPVTGINEDKPYNSPPSRFGTSSLFPPSDITIL